MAGERLYVSIGNRYLYSETHRRTQLSIKCSLPGLNLLHSNIKHKSRMLERRTGWDDKRIRMTMNEQQSNDYGG